MIHQTSKINFYLMISTFSANQCIMWLKISAVDENNYFQFKFWIISIKIIEEMC